MHTEIGIKGKARRKLLASRKRAVELEIDSECRLSRPISRVLRRLRPS